MKLLIDADGCPVVDISVRLAKRHNTQCVIVCDTSHIFDFPEAQTITVSKGADSADYAIANLAESGDIVVTQDYGLAAMCLAKGARPVSQDGVLYTDANIDSMLTARHTAKKIRSSGGRLKGPKKRRPEQNEAFEKALEAMLMC